MTALTNKADTRKAAEICDSYEKHGKIKVGVGERLQVVDATSGNNRAALNTLAATLRTDERETHPQVAGDAGALRDRKARKEVASMKDDVNFGSAPELGKALGVAIQESPKRTLQVDTKKYQAWLDDPELSDAQKEQIVEALWSIILCFVDLGFGVAPLQEACGKVSKTQEDSGDPDAFVLRCDAHTLTGSFNAHAAE